jgi:hypothetical protein
LLSRAIWEEAQSDGHKKEAQKNEANKKGPKGVEKSKANKDEQIR